MGDVFVTFCVMSKLPSFEKQRLPNRDAIRASWPAVLGLVVLGLTGCEPPPEPRTIDDFLEDSIAMDAKLRACRNDRKMAARDPECKAARQAAAKLSAAEQAAQQDRMQKSSEEELDRLRRQQQARYEAAEQRRQRMKDSAERKLENGEPLTAEEARLLGIDPDSSVLVKPDDQP